MEKTQQERQNEIHSYFKAVDELVQLCTEAQGFIRHGQFRLGITQLESVVNNATYLRDNIKDE
jgi:hypothetical protein